jgi:hypothetical protein
VSIHKHSDLICVFLGPIFHTIFFCRKSAEFLAIPWENNFSKLLQKKMYKKSAPERKKNIPVCPMEQRPVL